MQFTIELTDTDLLAGLTAARERYVRETPDAPREFSDADYVQMVMTRACESYAKTYTRTPQTLPDALERIATERTMRLQAESKLESRGESEAEAARE